MAGPNTLLTKNFVAGAALTRRRIVKHGAGDGLVVHAAAATDAAIGVVTDLGAASGARVDVHMIGLAEVEYGDTVTRGQYLTADAQGRAVPATLQAGSVVRVIGQATVSGVVGDIGVVNIMPAAAVGTLDALVGGITGTPVFVVGAEAGDEIDVSIQLRDAGGVNLAQRASLLAYLSDDAAGDSLTATAPDGGVAIDSDGLAIPLVAGKAFQLVSEADGHIDLTIGEAGAGTWYLVLVLPNGALAVSGAITFGA